MRISQNEWQRMVERQSNEQRDVWIADRRIVNRARERKMNIEQLNIHIRTNRSKYSLIR